MEAISQNTSSKRSRHLFDYPAMAKKRRTSSKKRTYLGKSRARITGVNRQWPYASQKAYINYWDPFPAVAYARLRYSEVVSLNPSAGVPAVNLFRAGSIYDPNQSGAGHQPYGHDTYATIYNHYKVIRSVITMQPTQKLDGMFGISLKDDTTVEGNYNTIREAKGTRFAVMSSQGESVKVMQFYNANAIMKNTDATDANFGSNPADDVFFCAWSEAFSSTNEPSACNFLFTITYDVKMWELRDLGQS